MVTPSKLKVLAESHAATALLFKNCPGRADFCGANESPQAVRLSDEKSDFSSEASESKCQIGGKTDRLSALRLHLRGAKTNHKAFGSN